MTTQYLQVPKALPYRRQRSRSRTRETPVVTSDLVSPAPFRSPSPKLRRKPDMVVGHVDSTPVRLLHDGATNALTNGHAAAVAAAVEEPRINHDDEARTNYDDLAEEQPYTLPKTPPPPEPPRLPLRQRLVGAWKLESYIAYPTPHSPIQRPTYPMTKNVTGFIMYTPDGYMSAQMLIPGQQSFKRGEGEEPQWAEAGKRFFAYGGPYYITDEGEGRREVLRHTFQVCNLPGWLGDIQIRTHKFIEDDDGLVLELGSEEPTEIKVSCRVISTSV